MGDLLLDPITGNDCPVFAPVKLEGIARSKDQWHESAASGCPGSFLLSLPPVSGESGYTIIGTRIAQLNQICMQLLQAASLLAASTG